MMGRIESSFVTFLCSKFGIILGIFFLLFLLIVFFVYKKWDIISNFFQKLISGDDKTSTTRWVMIFQVVVSNLCFWPTWLVLCVMDNIDNTPDMPFTMIDVPVGVWTIYGLANGIPAVTKFVQKFAEGKNGNDSSGK